MQGSSGNCKDGDDRTGSSGGSPPVWKSKFYGAFVLNHRVVLHAIDAMPARWPPRCVAYTSADEATLLPAPEGVFQ